MRKNYNGVKKERLLPRAQTIYQAKPRTLMIKAEAEMVRLAL